MCALDESGRPSFQLVQSGEKPVYFGTTGGGTGGDWGETGGTTGGETGGTTGGSTTTGGNDF